MFVPFRLSIRAFTHLFDDETMDSSPLFTDTFLSLPISTEAGEDNLPYRGGDFLSSDRKVMEERRKLRENINLSFLLQNP